MERINVHISSGSRGDIVHTCIPFLEQSGGISVPELTRYCMSINTRKALGISLGHQRIPLVYALLLGPTS